MTTSIASARFFCALAIVVSVSSPPSHAHDSRAELTRIKKVFVGSLGDKPGAAPLQSKVLEGFINTSLAVLIGLVLSMAFLAAGGRLSGLADAGQAERKVTLIVHLDQPQAQRALRGTAAGVQVSEHGKALQVLGGPREAGPKQVAVVLDANLHQRNVVALEKATAEQLLNDLEGGKARGAILSYGTQIQASGELTEGWAALKSFNRSIEADSDKRNEAILMFDAMERGMAILGSGPGTKALVLFAEGNDRGSSVGWRSLARLAQRNHIACYIVLFADHSFYGPKAIRHYGWDLVELAPKTGGTFWEAGSNSREAQRIIAQVESQIASQCLIEVIPLAGSAGRFHSLKVSASGKRIPAQTGYFD
jgi:hypothetical protein